MKQLLVLSSFLVVLAVACGQASGTPPPTQAAPSTITREADATETHTPSSTFTSTFIPAEYLIQYRSKDGMVMVYVPEGNSSMGSSSGEPVEQPPHSVYLDAFWIDQTEVTNTMYLACVQAGICRRPRQDSSKTDASYFGNPGYDLFPVIHVDWSDAAAYCAWVKGRLPTEAEWEKAARGTDGRIYPWGNGDPTCSLANFWGPGEGCPGDSMVVGSYPAGASPYGAMDMAGNVSEWVADWFGYYLGSGRLVTNPAGPDSGDARVVRGGSWMSEGNDLRASKRSWMLPTADSFNLGFRCAQAP